MVSTKNVILGEKAGNASWHHEIIQVCAPYRAHKPKKAAAAAFLFKAITLMTYGIT